MKQFKKLADFCSENDICYSDEMDSRFAAFCNLLEEKNKVMNLTGVTEPSEVEIIHYLDSVEAALEIKQLFGSLKGLNVVDMGTGAGFPGMPLKIVMPESDFLLADALNKRIGFLNEVIRELGLENVTAMQGRAEEFGQSEYRESFDVCVSRAVADMSVLLEYCLPMVKTGGYAVMYKSGDYREELQTASYAMETLGGTLHSVREFFLPGSEIARSLIVIRKIDKTPEKYPRRPGKPAKSPLIKK